MFGFRFQDSNRRSKLTKSVRYPYVCFQLDGKGEKGIAEVLISDYENKLR